MNVGATLLPALVAMAMDTPKRYPTPGFDTLYGQQNDQGGNRPSRGAFGASAVGPRRNADPLHVRARKRHQASKAAGRARKQGR